MISNNEKALLDLIARGEGTSDRHAQQHGIATGYDITYSYGQFNPTGYKPVSQLKIFEVRAFQRKMLDNQANRKLRSTAVGKYQIISKTLNLIVDALNLPETTVFNQDTQDQMALYLLNTRGFKAWKTGTLSGKQFQANCSKEWASIENPFTGKSFYDQPVGTTTEDFQAILERIRLSK